MVRTIFIFTILFTLKLCAQTTVYAATPEGLPDKNRYCLFDYGKFLICDDSNGSLKHLTSFEEHQTVVFSKDHITINLAKSTSANDMHMIFGYTNEERKIFFAKVEKKEDKVYISLEPSSEEIKNAPYVYDKKVYDANGNIIAFIEGDTKFGAAWYLLMAKSGH